MNIIDTQLYESAKKGNKRAGQANLIKHLTGNRLTQNQAIQAKCYDCSGMGEQSDCDNTSCPLLFYSKYQRKSQIRAVDITHKQ